MGTRNDSYSTPYITFLKLGTLAVCGVLDWDANAASPSLNIEGRCLLDVARSVHPYHNSRRASSTTCSTTLPISTWDTSFSDP